MGNLTRYTTADLPTLFDKITRNAIGMDDYFDRIFALNETTNYPPYNLVQVNNVESRLEIALAGFKKEEVNVYTEFGKLFVSGNKESDESETRYAHRGIAQRTFTRSWTASDDTEVGSVTFEDEVLTIELSKVVLDHHHRKDYL